METYKCRNCGAVTTTPGHLCAPEPVASKSEYCGQSAQPCEPKQQTIQYTCGQCGRAAEQPDLLCKPTRISVSRCFVHAGREASRRAGFRPRREPQAGGRRAALGRFPVDRSGGGSVEGQVQILFASGLKKGRRRRK